MKNALSKLCFIPTFSVNFLFFKFSNLILNPFTILAKKPY